MNQFGNSFSNQMAESNYQDKDATLNKASGIRKV